MMTYNPAIQRLDMPARFLKLPVDTRGYPVPKFVEWIDGKPDFRVVDHRWLVKAVKQRLCWLCGEPLGRHMAFVIGPMCAINRINSEPPSHLDCARFAVRAYPFMVQPARRRNDENLPEGALDPAGIAIMRNPGAMVIWVTESYRPFQANGTLFKLGEPTKLEWYARGQPASRDEVMASINSGLPLLRELAEKDGPEGVAELEKNIERGLALVPA
jgi:hypothetical protein